MKHAFTLTAAMVWLVAACNTSPVPTGPESQKDPPELATTSLWMPLDITFPNECPPVELVAFSGKAHFVVRESGDQSNVYINWADVKGVGLVTGQRYVVQDNTQIEVIPLGEGTLTVREHLRMIRLGSLDNVNAFATLTLNLTTGVEVFELDLRCQG
jgi:hypothetical protein